jgi:group I intron endonuclease
MTSCIYTIKNKDTGMLYLGRTINFDNRIADHKKTLRGNRHRNKRLQNSWNFRGEDKFEFAILWEEKEADLPELEGFLLNEFWDSGLLYNHHKLSEGGFQKGNKLGCFVRSKETRQKMSIAFTGRVFSDSHKEKIKLAKTGVKATQETKNKMSKAKLGKERPESWHKAMDEYRKHNPNPMQGKTSPMNGKKFPTIACEHCGKEASKGNYNRWHGSNCKSTKEKSC